MSNAETARTVLGRRDLLKGCGGAAALLLGRMAFGEESAGTDIIAFEETLAAQRRAHYGNREVDIIGTGFRPVGGNVADFAVTEINGRLHFYYIERRLKDGTPFYPGHEIFFGHASTANFVDWNVHEPVLLIRPGTWEDGHMWAPCILRRGDELLMAYTGVSRHLSQDIGLASSTDGFEWRRWPSNPISPCKDKSWAFWREDDICSCRDPSLCEHDGRIWMIFTANTRAGASCIAMASTTDLKTWKDHGPICVGPADGYVARLEGGHPQGSLESANLVPYQGRWFLLVKAKVRDSNTRSWIIESDRVDHFDFAKRRPFWKNAFGIETIKHREGKALLTTFTGGHIKFGFTDWSAPQPVGRYAEHVDELRAWLD